jgi:hypothetical protein
MEYVITAIPPTDLRNLPDQKSYDIFNLIKPMMISMYLYLDSICLFAV